VRLSVILGLLATLLLAGMSSAQEKLPSPSGVIEIGGPGGWDYLAVDTLSHRLFVSHFTHVVIVDLVENKVVGDIPNTPGVHGIAFAPELNRGFISDGRDSSVTVIDLKTDSAIAVVKVSSANPDAILYDPFSKRVFTFNGRSSNASAIDARSLKLLGTVPLSGRPEFAVSDLSGKLYVDIEDKGTLAVIDPQALTVTAEWSLAPLEEPSGLAIDRTNHRLFSVGRNKLMAIVDSNDGKVLTTVPIGGFVDGVEFDPSTHMAFSSNGDGSLTVVREKTPDTFAVLGTVPTERGARTIALDEQTHRLYLSVGTRPDKNGIGKNDFRVLVYRE
jgi:DNA-binding beta-propeller fold protein YncE